MLTVNDRGASSAKRQVSSHIRAQIAAAKEIDINPTLLHIRSVTDVESKRALFQIAHCACQRSLRCNRAILISQ